MEPGSISRWTAPKTNVVLIISTTCGSIVLALALLYLNTVPDCRADQQEDSFTYIELARNLLIGEGYPTKHWMPGFSLALTGLIGPFGANWIILKLAMIVVSLLTFSLSLRLFQRVAPRSSALPLAVVLASTPLYFDYSHRVMSEIPAVATTLATLVAMDGVRTAAGRKGRLFWGIALPVAGVVAILIRGNALALAPALLVSILNAQGPSARQVRWVLASSLACLLLAYGAWTLRAEYRHYSGIHNVTYSQEIQAKDIGALWDASGKFGDGVERVDAAYLVRRIYQNIVWHQSYRIAGFLVPRADRLIEIKFPGIGVVMVAIFLVPQLVGFVRLSRQSPELATFLLFSIGLIVVYPTGGSPRMLVPFLPMLILTGYLGIDRLMGTQRAVGWLICVMASNLVQCAIEADIQRIHPYAKPGFEDFVALVEDELPKLIHPGDIVATHLGSELFAIAGVRPRSIVSVGADVDAGRLGSALIVHQGEYTPGSYTGSTVLARSGQTEILRIEHRKQGEIGCRPPRSRRIKDRHPVIDPANFRVDVRFAAKHPRPPGDLFRILGAGFQS